jgi:hypothetical protein
MVYGARIFQGHVQIEESVVLAMHSIVLYLVYTACGPVCTGYLYVSFFFSTNNNNVWTLHPFAVELC